MAHPAVADIPHIVTCDYSRRRIQTGGEYGRTGSCPLDLSGLSRLANQGREITTPSAFLLAVALLTLSETAGLPAKMSLSGRLSAGVFRKPLPSKWGAHVRSKVGKAARAHPEISQCHTFVQFTFVASNISVAVRYREAAFGRNNSRRRAPRYICIV